MTLHCTMYMQTQLLCPTVLIKCSICSKTYSTTRTSGSRNQSTTTYHNNSLVFLFFSPLCFRSVFLKKMFFPLYVSLCVSCFPLLLHVFRFSFVVLLFSSVFFYVFSLFFPSISFLCFVSSVFFSPLLFFALRCVFCPSVFVFVSTSECCFFRVFFFLPLGVRFFCPVRSVFFVPVSVCFSARRRVAMSPYGHTLHSGKVCRVAPRTRSRSSWLWLSGLGFQSIRLLSKQPCVRWITQGLRGN